MPLMLKDELKKLDIFKNLNEQEILQIVNISTQKELFCDNILFYEGEDSNYFYALLDGHLKLYKTGIKSNEVVLHYFTQPTMIAEMASLEGIKFPATAIATKDNTKVLLIDKEKFLRLLEEDSTFSFHIIRSLTKKIKALELAINRNLVFDATTKVAMYINNNPIEFKNGKNKKIASELNITPETLSRVLRKLKEIKIIDKKLNLLDQDKLQMFINFNLN